MPPDVHHIGLTVGDLDRSVAWYCTHLGFREIARAHLDGERISRQTDLPGTELEVALLVGSNVVLELLQYASPEGRPTELRTCDVGAAHVCVVVEDLHATYAAMSLAGVIFHAEPTQLVGTTTMVYVRDPDGVMVELIEPHEDLGLGDLLCAASLQQADGGSPG